MGLRNLTVNAGNWNVEERTGYVDLSIENTYKGNKGHEFSVGMTFKVCADGVLRVNTAVTPAISGVVLPKIGFRTEMPEGFDRVAWFGRGPWESYADRKEACFEGGCIRFIMSRSSCHRAVWSRRMPRQKDITTAGLRLLTAGLLLRKCRASHRITRLKVRRGI